MIYIHKDNQVPVEWEIFKGASNVHEDFSRSELRVFLIGPTNRYLVPVVSSDNGVIKFSSMLGVPEGAYSVEAIWYKNDRPYPFDKHGRLTHNVRRETLMTSRADFIYAITEHPEEATVLPQGARIKIDGHVASYGYDGMDAWVTATFYGETANELEWLDAYTGKLAAVQEAENNANTAAEYANTQGLKAVENADKALRSSERADTATTAAYSVVQDMGTLKNQLVSAENERVKEENRRVSAEGARATAEQRRQSDSATAVQNANSATSNANSAATNANNKAVLANEAAESANTAASNANSALQTANTLQVVNRDILGRLVDIEKHENTRVSEDEKRSLNERDRIVNERSRSEAEEARIAEENVRIQNEEERGRQENYRQTGENNRQQTFETNELARQNQFDQKEAERDAAIQDVVNMREKVATLEQRVNTIEQNGVGGGGIAWKDVENGEVMKSVEEILTLVGISASLNLGSTTIYKGDSVARLKPYLSVLALYDNGTSKPVTDYTLSGNLANSTNTIVVTYGGFSKNIVVNAEEREGEPIVTLIGISVSVNIGDNVITKGDDLESIRQYLTVTANYSDGDSINVTDYVLSGSLDKTSNTIIVSYEGFTETIIINAEEPLSMENPTAAIYDNGYLLVDYNKSGGYVIFAKNTAYSNRNGYDIYQINSTDFKSKFDVEDDNFIIGIPKSSKKSNVDFVGETTSEDIICAYYDNNYVVKVKQELAQDGIYNYLMARYNGRIPFKLKNDIAENATIIDADKITSMTKKVSAVGSQWAHFGYSALPSSSVFGFSSLFFKPGGNANLEAQNHCAFLSTSVLSISFDGNTFKDFTLDNVKAYLKKYPLIFY